MAFALLTNEEDNPMLRMIALVSALAVFGLWMTNADAADAEVTAEASAHAAGDTAAPVTTAKPRQKRPRTLCTTLKVRHLHHSCRETRHLKKTY